KTISELFDFVEQQCHFIKSMTHIKQRGTSIKKDYLGVKASILANGTMQGTYAFSKRSNLKYKRLQLADKNHVRLQTLRDAADVIGPNEHESHFTYPLVRRNNTSVDLNIISTDTEGANNVNDFLYYLINKTHAPCYRSTAKKAKKSIIGFKAKSEYKDLLIQPV